MVGIIPTLGLRQDPDTAVQGDRATGPARAAMGLQLLVGRMYLIHLDQMSCA